MALFKDEQDKIYSKLTVIDFAGADNGARWNCLCECGGLKIVSGTNLRAGSVTSCGCVQKESRIRNGKKLVEGKDKRSQHPLYDVWRKMIDRCDNIKHFAYKNYGKRGIKVCEQWYDFWKFVADMGNRPRNYTLERKDNNSGYYKENCKWASYSEQNKNRRPFKRH